MKRYLLYTAISTAFLFASAFTSFQTGNDDSYASTPWTLDEAHSTIQFKVTHFFTPVTGRFDEYQTDIQFDPNDLENSSIDVSIPIISINTQNERRDNHLNSEDFFNVENWPNITFTSDDIRRTEIMNM